MARQNPGHYCFYKASKNTAILCATNTISNFPQMHRSAATYGAYRRNRNERIPLLPSVYTWNNDNKGITLLERTDGSVWMANAIRSSSSANLVAKTGEYESSNVFQVSPATTSKITAEFIDLNRTKFTDVSTDAWYAAPVQWAVDKGNYIRYLLNHILSKNNLHKRSDCNILTESNKIIKLFFVVKTVL